MPDTSMGITYPASTAHTRLWEHFQELASDLNGLLDLPDPVAAHGNGINTITATTYTDLPTVTCIAAITNPHATRPMLVQVNYGAWITSSTNSVRMVPRTSGSVTIAAGSIGSGGPVGYGEIIRTGTTEYQQYHAVYTVELPVSATAATFTMTALREAASGLQQVNYATIRLTPLRFVA